MANIVLVPGGYHGGWYYSPLLPALRAAGHAVYTISLSGLDGPATRPRMAIILDGSQPNVMDSNVLVRANLPMDWSLQRKLLGFQAPRRDLTPRNLYQRGMWPEKPTTT